MVFISGKVAENHQSFEIFRITKHPDSESFSLSEKCPNTEFFLLRIFTYSD